MTPTMKLRFVKRPQRWNKDRTMLLPEQTILQQWWEGEPEERWGPDGIEDYIPGEGAWIDVPVEAEALPTDEIKPDAGRVFR